MSGRLDSPPSGRGALRVGLGAVCLLGALIVALPPTGRVAGQSGPPTVGSPTTGTPIGGTRWRPPRPEGAGERAENGTGATGRPATGPNRDAGWTNLSDGPEAANRGREPERTATRTGAGVALPDGKLPNEAGQVWREYDLSPYTVRVTDDARPEQAVVDWILRTTGYETWHGTTVAVLAAERRRLRVYHTPEVQRTVAELVERFNAAGGEPTVFDVQLHAVGSPSWRAAAGAALRPIPVETQGVQAWLVAKEEAALLVAQLKRRLDFKELNRTQAALLSGRARTIDLRQRRPYARDVEPRPDLWPGLAPVPGEFIEGLAVELNPLPEIDGRSVDAVVRVEIDQLERLVPVGIETTTSQGQRQKVTMQVPQSAQFRMQERIRWPADQVLLISLGVAPNPAGSSPTAPSPTKWLGPDRDELLLLIDARGRLTAGRASGPAR